MQISSQFSAQSNFVKISDKQNARHMSNLNTRTFHNVLKYRKCIDFLDPFLREKLTGCSRKVGIAIVVLFVLIFIVVGFVG